MEYFRIGGWGMWPTLVFGALMVFAALRLALRPRRGALPLLGGLGVLTFSSGTLGFVTGVIKSFQAIGGVGPDKRYIALIGVAESLHSLALAFLLIGLATMAAVVGAIRLSRTGGSSLGTT
jgi:hypothetical protein